MSFGLFAYIFWSIFDEKLKEKENWFRKKVEKKIIRYEIRYKTGFSKHYFHGLSQMK